MNSLWHRIGISIFAVAMLFSWSDAKAQFKPPKIKPPVVHPPVIKPIPTPRPTPVPRPTPRPAPTPRPTPRPVPIPIPNVVINVRPNLQVIEPYVPPPAINFPTGGGTDFLPDNGAGTDFNTDSTPFIDPSMTDPGTAEPDLSTIEPNVNSNEPDISTLEPDPNLQPIETIEDFNTAIGNDPMNASLYQGRGGLYSKQGDYELAIADYDQSISLDPEHANAYNGRAWLRATCPDDKFRDGMKAYKDAKRACELTQWTEANFVDSLAAAFAELGDFNNAIKIEQRAVKLGSNDPATQAEFEAHVRLFQAREPVREAPESAQPGASGHRSN